MRGEAGEQHPPCAHPPTHPAVTEYWPSHHGGYASSSDGRTETNAAREGRLRASHVSASRKRPSRKGLSRSKFLPRKRLSRERLASNTHTKIEGGEVQEQETTQLNKENRKYGLAFAEAKR
jgi:hypothetical protein